MSLSKMLAKMARYHRLTLTAIGFLGVSAISLPNLFILGFIITFDIVVWVNTVLILLGIFSVVLLIAHLKMKHLDKRLRQSDVVITSTKISPNVEALKPSYQVQSYDSTTKVYKTTDRANINECFVKELNEDRITLWPKCRLENEMQVGVRNVVRGGLTLVETSEGSLCILDASNLMLQIN